MSTVRPTAPGAVSVPLVEAPVAPVEASSVAAPRATSVTTPSAAVLADLRAARITPDEAVRQLTALAVRNAGATASMQPVVEQRIRETLARDPTLGALLRRMGATVPRDEE